MMNIDWVALVEGGIPALAGLYITALAYGGVRWPARPDGRPRMLETHGRWLGPVLILAGFFIGWQTHQRSAHPSAERMAREISARFTLPAQVDAATRIDAVVGEGEKITYRYTVVGSIDPDVSLATFETKLREQARSQACSGDEGLVRLLRAGYTVELQYALPDAGRNISIVMPPGFCAS